MDTQTVLSLYGDAKDKLSGQVAKKVVGFHLFGNRMLTSEWNQTFKDWLDWVQLIERERTPMPVLGGQATREVIPQIAAGLAKRGYLTQNEARQIESTSSICLKPANERAQAVGFNCF